ncbi:hypothetical protein BKA93DRAFT_252875 [Sparassis latifolia]
MPHHPFRREDAPYMESYSAASLENEHYSFVLLCHLNALPTFKYYGKPPENILDLGCGQGFWVLHAANSWADSHVTGIDLIDVHRFSQSRVRRENVSWVRGNFVKDDLPFPDDTFDLVRMANLTLCVPTERWNFVLTQVRRVLKPGGRLEFIDDELFFPCISSPAEASCQFTRPLSCNSTPITSYSDSEDSGVGNDGPLSCDIPLRRTRTWSIVPHEWPSRFHGDYTPSDSRTNYEMSVDIATSLEGLFENMLDREYKISCKPGMLIPRLLTGLFGNAHKSHFFELFVPEQTVLVGEDVNSKAARVLSDGSIAPKAARFLLSGKKSISSCNRPPYQPPGLVVYRTTCGIDRYEPPTVILFDPCELEMHACKNMNTLLGCKHALTNFALDQRDKNGDPTISEEQFSERVWDYDQFRRKRFNWPADYPGLRMEEDDDTPAPKPMLLRLFSNLATLPIFERQPYLPGDSPRKDDKRLMNVRRISVYQAVKAPQA